MVTCIYAIVAAVLWSGGAFLLLFLLIVWFEAGKGFGVSERMIREEDDDALTARYRRSFCMRLAVAAGFALEAYRIGGGATSALLSVIAVASFFVLSPARRWMR